MRFLTDILFYFLYGLLWLVAWLPLKLLYLISDCLYWLVYYLVRYRRKIVRKNLTLSFPDYSLQEIIALEKKFYRYFCDLQVEILWQIHASTEEMNKRMTIENPELLAQYAEKDNSVMLMLGHYGNWEWISVFGLQLPKKLPPCPVYMQLRNKHFDQLMLDLRTRFGAYSIERKRLIREIVAMKQDGRLGIFVMISDQSPRFKQIRHRMQFMNQDTPVFLGTEQLARKYGYPVYYLDIQRVKRGYYHSVVRPIAVDPMATEENEITETFMRLLENSIQAKPEFWLWSHNRWKHNHRVTTTENESLRIKY